MSKPVVLLIEDDLMLVYAMKIMLEEDVGFVVEVAHNAKEALQQLRQLSKLDLVILDIMLPVAGAFERTADPMEAGLNVLKAMRRDEWFRRWQKLPVIAYTVRADNSRIRKALEELNAYVISKVEDPEDVLHAIKDKFPVRKDKGHENT